MAKELELENEDLCEIAASIENGRPIDSPFRERIYAVIEQAFLGDNIRIINTPGIDTGRPGNADSI